MQQKDYPTNVQKFIDEMIKRKVVEDDIKDPMLINYLYTQVYDEDYIDSMMNDRD
jgi:hypothetical protein